MTTTSIDIKTWSGANNKPSTGGYYAMDLLDHQIELIANGVGRNASTGSYTWQKSPKYIFGASIARATYVLEAVYRNQSPEDWTFSLIDSNGVVLGTVVLPTTGTGNDANHWHRVRSTEAFAIPNSGTYRLKDSGSSVEAVAFNVRLIATQTQFRETVINIPMLIAANGTYADTGGIGGGDIYRNSTTGYLPTLANEGLGHVAGNQNFILWKYIASEWNTIEHLYLEATSDGFSDDYHIALFDHDTDTIVPSSDIHVQTTAMTNSLQEITLSELIDGHVYGCKIKSNGSANAFLYNLNLQVHMSSVKYGNAYYRVNNGNHGQAKSLLPAGMSRFYHSMTGYPRAGTNNVYALNNGTADNGTGSQVAASVINLTNSVLIKNVQRSSELLSSLTVGNRYDAEDDGGNTVECNLIGQFEGTLHPCL